MDPIQYLWEWITGSTPFTGGWIAVICLAVAIPVGVRQTVSKYRREKAELKRSGRPRGLRGRTHN